MSSARTPILLERFLNTSRWIFILGSEFREYPFVADAGLRQSCGNVPNNLKRLLKLYSNDLWGETAGDYDDLLLGYCTRYNKIIVVSMDHGHGSNDAGGGTPGTFPGE